MSLTPPDFDSKPLYTDGVGIGWVGYGMFMEWPSASFQVFDWKDYWLDDEDESTKAHARADAAMRTLWSDWFNFYHKHFRSPGISISMADQQAFFEIAQPIMYSLVDIRAATDWKAEHGVVLQGLVEANDKIAELKRALTANDTMLRILEDTGLDKATDEGLRKAFALRMMISANADLLTGEKT